ncbi:MAG: hypothetical protein J6U26_06655 [Lachnospiraceae bacterium]|nr:hypothetical protein [Lachnospiraceae bacterium]
MSLMEKLERKMGGSHLPNMMIPLIVCYAVGFVISYIAPAVQYWLVFNPELIFRGQVWRIFTFVLCPESSSFFMALITCFIYFSISRGLEQIIGRFRLNFFLLSGLLILVLVGFAYYFVCVLVPGLEIFGSYTVVLNPYYLYGMLFVLFALAFPDAQFLFMFLFPIKGKWMIFLTLIMYILDVGQAFLNGNAAYGWIIVAMIAAAILTLLLYMMMIGYGRPAAPRNVVRMRSYTRQGAAPSDSARHKCCICGRTERTNPELDFRYCSYCVGNYEYCSDHLYSHIHKKPSGDT